MPKAHQEQGKWTPKRLLHWANKIGLHTEDFIQKMIESKPFPEQSFRSCLGLLRLSKGYGNDRLEAACKKGLEVGAYRYQHIESILKNRLDSTHEHQNHQTPVINSHKNIRGSNYYQ